MRTIAYNKVRKFEPFEIVNDYVLLNGETSNYKLLELDLTHIFNTVDEKFKDYDLRFSLITYIGDANLFIHPDTAPK